MGWRFRQRVKIAPGIRINLSKGLPSLSVGRPGDTLNLSKRGRRVTFGLPGSGFSYSKNLDPAEPGSPLANSSLPPSGRDWAAIIIIGCSLIGLIVAIGSALL